MGSELVVIMLIFIPPLIGVYFFGILLEIPAPSLSERIKEDLKRIFDFVSLCLALVIAIPIVFLSETLSKFKSNKG